MSDAKKGGERKRERHTEKEREKEKEALAPFLLKNTNFKSCTEVYAFVQNKVPELTMI